MAPKYNKFAIIILTFAIPALMATGIDLYAPSLPEITRYFATTTSTVKLTVGFYLLGYGGSPIFFGILSDSYGRRKILLISIFVFFIASIFAVFAPNIYIFLGIRLLQGIAIGGVGLVINSLLADSFTGVDLAKMASYMTISWASGQIMGPFIGSHLLHYFGWQANFYYFAIYGLFIFIITLFWLPETNRYLHPCKMLLVLTSYLKILKHRVFISGVLTMTLIQSIATTFSTLGPFIIQDTMKYSAIVYGYIGCSMGIAYFLGGLSNRLFINHIAPLQAAFRGLFCLVVISCLMILFSIYLGINIYIIILPSFLSFYCNGIIFPNCLGKCLEIFPENAGAASAILETFFGIGMFFMSVIAALLKNSTQLPIAISFACLSILSLIIYNYSFLLPRKTK